MRSPPVVLSSLQKPGPSQSLGCPNTGHKCVLWRRRGTGGHAKGQSKFMGQNPPRPPTHIPKVCLSQRATGSTSQGAAGAAELRRRGWMLQEEEEEVTQGVGRGYQSKAGRSLEIVKRIREAGAFPEVTQQAGIKHSDLLALSLQIFLLPHVNVRKCICVLTIRIHGQTSGHRPFFPTLGLQQFCSPLPLLQHNTHSPPQPCCWGVGGVLHFQGL